MNSETWEKITCVNANVFHIDNEPVTVDINITVRLDDGEHSVSITWDPHTLTTCPLNASNTPKDKRE